MTYASYITTLRNEVGDVSRPVHVDWIADGATSVFQMPVDTFPVLDQSATYTLKKNGSLLTEGTDYTLDKDAGVIVMASTPSANDALAWDGRAIYLTDASWLAIVQDTIRSLGLDFFKEFTDTTTLTTTYQQTILPLATAFPRVFAVYQFQFQNSPTDRFVGVERYANWRFSREDQPLYSGTPDAFPQTGLPIKIRGLSGYNLGSAVTDTIDVQDMYMTIVQYGSIARYWQWRYKSVIELVSKMTQEPTRTPLQELMMLNDRFQRLYEAEKARLKPAKPARIIPAYKEGGGNP